MIRRLAAEGVPKARIAERLAISRNPVALAVASTEPPKSSAAARRGDVVHAVRGTCVDCCSRSSRTCRRGVIAERVGWSGSPVLVPGERGSASTGASSAGPGGSVGVGAGRCGAVRLVVPAAADPARGRHCGAVAGVGHRPGALAVHLRGDGADAADPGSLVRVVVADRGVRAGAAPPDLGQRDGDRPTQPPRAGRRVCGTLATGSINSRPATPNRRASSSAATGSSRHRSCRIGSSIHRPISTPSSPTGWSGPTVATGANAQGATDRSR